ncbi:MAG: TRAP transporter large permease subunit [Spirochaetota bacterium]
MFDLSSLGIGPVTILVFGSMLILLVARVPLAFLTGIISISLTVGWFSWETLPLVANRVYGFMNSYSLLAVPMFVLMAALLDQTGIAKDLYNAMWLFTRKLKGGVAIQTVIIGVFLAAISGIIGGETVLLGLLALPQMLRLGYSKNLAIGTCVSSGALGTMVPPSIVLIIYGLTASVSIGDLFTAAFVPAFMLAGLYIVYIILYGMVKPDKVPSLSKEEIDANPIGRAQRLRAIRDIALPGFIAVTLLGSIYLGVASVTEAASVGVIAVILVAAYRREFRLAVLQSSLRTTMQTCGMIMWIGIGAYILVGVYNLVGGNRFIEQMILGLGWSPVAIIVVMMLILIFLGMFMDWIGIAMLTVPIFVPIIQTLGYDPVWFGILFCVNMQISFLSPPFGPGAFYLHSVAPEGITLVDIFRSVLPYILMQALILALLITFPQIALFMPNLLRG